MKYIYKTLSFIALLMATSSCNDDFLETEIFSDVAPSNFFKSNSDLETALLGSYDAFQKAIDATHWQWGEARSDNFRRSTRSTPNDLLLINNDLNFTIEAADWGDLYTTIGQTNLVIGNVSKVPNANQSLLGEAHALRALAYFYIIRLWGDAPIITVGIDQFVGDFFFPREDMNSIINDVIIPDINIAESLLTSPGGKARFNRGSILALKAHIYSWIGGQNNLIIANQAIDDIIELGTYRLVTTREEWRDMFTESGGENGPELIFSIPIDFATDGESVQFSQDQLNDGGSSYFFSISLGQKWLEKFPVTQTDWEALYGPVSADRIDIGIDEEDPNFGLDLPLYGDWRLKESARFDASPFGRSRARTTLKYLKQRNDDDGREQAASDYPIYRYAGLILLKAEVLVRLGGQANINEAIELVNEVRAARDLPLEITNITSQNDALDLVLDERQFELYGEAHRWYDLRRNDKVFDEVLTDGDARNDDVPIENVGLPLFDRSRPGRLLWPIGANVIRTNDNINSEDQNPDY